MERTLWKALRFGAFVAALGFHVYHVYFYLSDVLFLAASNSFSNVILRWNYSQVIALSVWAPPIFEYVYLQSGKTRVRQYEVNTDQIIGGMKGGFDYKSRPPYKFIRQDDIEEGGTKE